MLLSECLAHQIATVPEEDGGGQGAEAEAGTNCTKTTLDTHHLTIPFSQSCEPGMEHLQNMAKFKWRRTAARPHTICISDGTAWLSNHGMITQGAGGS
mmetsp:Transcript_6179/g.10558  ORF Transcript_6179/g.10558 Transcript_6179/m.10558 type:complete len:98 (+) Transcript_6179:2908-3201(+)